MPITLLYTAMPEESEHVNSPTV